MQRPWLKTKRDAKAKELHSVKSPEMFQNSNLTEG